jgi:hypothetical protein
LRFITSDGFGSNALVNEIAKWFPGPKVLSFSTRVTILLLMDYGTHGIKIIHDDCGVKRYIALDIEKAIWFLSS